MNLPITIINGLVVPPAQYYAIWQAYYEQSGDVAARIVKLATAYETAQYPSAVLATFHARDFRDVLNRMASL
ncbi:hypothetical protein Q8I65_18100 [Paenibacillus ottowii]|uniref:hypothetical protein n=1 Tax=Paenibacillus ottowii TaxID=2315729 RepID=UPI002731F0D3|nr:hypothetical protein [Paenibacillus ottowii]MDP1512092.1 hypothetical protein [Paenibacillus ottowii]